MLRDEDTWVASWQQEIISENTSPTSFPLAYFSHSARRLYRFGHTVGMVNIYHIYSTTTFEILLIRAVYQNTYVA